MSEMGTAVEIPRPPRAGVWVPGLGNTDLEFVQKLVGRSIADEATLYELPPADSLASNQAERRIRGRSTICIPDTRGVMNVGQPWAFAPGRSVFVVGGIHGARTALGLGSAQVMQVAIPETSGPWLQERLQLFRPTGVPVFLESYELSLRDVATAIVYPDLQTVSSTAPTRNPNAEARFKTIFRRGREERFEDGMESEFSKELESLIRAYGPSSREVLARLLEDDRVSARVWGEAMRCLGRFDDPGSYEARLWVIEKGLTSGSALVRDGAALGLASMDDPSAIPYLQRAIDSETLGGLRADMQEVVSQLTR